jgi:arylsulfatase A-like enzyme
VVNEALTSVDFFPTIMTLLGAENSQAVDGRDASELLAGKATDWHDVAFMRSTPTQPWLSAVTSRFKLVISKSDKPWLIDLQADPSEVVNLYGQSKHNLLIRQLTEELRDYARKHDDPHVRIPEIRQQLFGAKN